MHRVTVRPRIIRPTLRPAQRSDRPNRSIRPYDPGIPLKPIRLRRNIIVKPPTTARPVHRINPVKRSVRPQNIISPSRPRVPAVVRKNAILSKRKLPRYADPKALKKIDEIKGIGQGRILVIVASGPSISEASLEKVKAHPIIDVMAINKPDQRIWPPRFWTFCDQSQYTRNKESWDKYNGTIINASSVRARRSNQVLVRSKHGRGFSKDLRAGVYIGRSSTYVAMQVAHWMGHDRVYIFGLDMTNVGNRLWFYGKNPDVPEEERKRRFAKEAESYQYAADHLGLGERQRFFICSSYNPWPFVEKFIRKHQASAVEEIIDYADKLNRPRKHNPDGIKTS